MRIIYWALGILAALVLLTWARNSPEGAGVLIAVIFVALGFGLGHFVGVVRETKRFLRLTRISRDEWQTMKARDERERNPQWIQIRETIGKVFHAARRK